jgi:hypothetical protein
MRAVMAVLGLALAVASAARADPRLDEKVYDPYVEPGVLEVEARTAGLIDSAPGGGESASVFEWEYGVQKHLSLALVAVEGVQPHEGSRWRSVGVEAVVGLGRIPKIGVDSALYLEVQHGLGGEPDSVEGKLLLAKRAGRFEGLLNLIVERPLNAPGGDFASYGYAASATWRTVGALRLGAEMLGDLGSDHSFGGRQAAWLGPQLKWSFRPFGGAGGSDADDDGDEDLTSSSHRAFWEVQVDAGWLAAIGPARSEAASQARLGVELERHF